MHLSSLRGRAFPKYISLARGPSCFNIHNLYYLTTSCDPALRLAPLLELYRDSLRGTAAASHVKMPKITSYNLEWLSKPNPGHALFTPSPATSRFYERVGNSRDGDDDGENAGPKRTIARRGTEVFVAVGNEIRWADLAYLKDKLEKEKNGEDSQNPPNWAQGYRVSSTCVSFK